MCYSYPLFSFQGSICFFSSEDYFIKSPSLRLVLFLVLFVFIFCCFRSNVLYLIRYFSFRQVLYSVPFGFILSLPLRFRFCFSSNVIYINRTPAGCPVLFSIQSDIYFMCPLQVIFSSAETQNLLIYNVGTTSASHVIMHNRMNIPYCLHICAQNIKIQK